MVVKCIDGETVDIDIASIVCISARKGTRVSRKRNGGTLSRSRGWGTTYTVYFSVTILEPGQRYKTVRLRPDRAKGIRDAWQDSLQLKLEI